jgi:hypothetical protein
VTIAGPPISAQTRFGEFMKQSEIVEAVTQGKFQWVPLIDGIEVMAWPLRIGESFVAVSARTAERCAVRLSGAGWIVSLTTPKLEDLIWEHAVFRPDPVLLNPNKINIASNEAVSEHSQKMRAKLAGIGEDALVALGKSWVLSNVLLARPNRAANYGLFSPSAPYRSATGLYRVWQPLSTAHNLDHSDYSQVLRLVRRRSGTPLPAYDNPLRVTQLDPTTPSPIEPAQPLTPVASGSVGGAGAVGADSTADEGASVGTLGERCLAWCLEEAAAHPNPSAERIRWYHAVAMRNGKPLGISAGNHCASAQSRALIECLLSGEVRPHEPRAGAIELQSDAVRSGRWRAVSEVRAGRWLPRPGDLAIYNRANPADPSTSWQRHVDRVIGISDDGAQFENIGANEVAGAWRREWTPFEHARLLGFIEYPGAPATAEERALLAALELGPEDAG